MEVCHTLDGLSSFIFQGQAQKIQIKSNNIGYGLCPEPGDEIEQRLTITNDGRIWFSGYNYGQGFGKYECGRTRNDTIGKEAAACILDTIGTYFSDEYDTVFATDIGNWELIVTNDDGKPYRFNGSLCCNFDIGGVDLSDLIRNTLDMPDLFMFDGKNKSDRVEKITIDYCRVTKIKPNVPISDAAEYCTWDYSEQLVINRESETLEHIQRVGSGCVISRKYYVQEGISGLLDDLETDSLFEHITGNDPDVITDPNETKNYEIIVDFHKRSQLVINGTYDKNGLPEDWPALAERILDFILFYGIGEILDPSVYMKAKRKAGDYIFCSVEFDGGGKSYYYLTEDDTLSIGDSVLVPVGNDSRTTIVEIVNIEYFPEDKVPFPLEKVKHIIRKCTDDDIHPPMLENEIADTEEFFCPVYDGQISQCDRDEISYAAKNGINPNDGLPTLIDNEAIKEKREICLACEGRKDMPEGALLYSDNWLKQGYFCSNRINVSDTVDYQLWSCHDGSTIGVTINFEIADDFHYNLLIADWNRFLVKVLCSPKAIAPKDAFRDYLVNNKGLLDFEEALKTHDIKFEKVAFY